MDFKTILFLVLTTAGLSILATVLYFNLRSLKKIKTLSLQLKHLLQIEQGQKMDSYDTQEKPGIAGLQNTLNQQLKELQTELNHINKERNTMAALLRNMTDGIISTDSEGFVTLINDAACHLLGITPGVTQDGRSFMQVVRDHELYALLKQTMNDGKERAQMLEMGPFRQQLQVKTALITEEGNSQQNTVRAYLVVMQDLTELTRLERIRRDFVANISHELRTPLASVKLMVETLQTIIEDDPQASSDFLRRIDTEIDGLTQLVRELLELSRIESGQIKLNTAAVDLWDLARQAAERLRSQAERCGLTLSVEPVKDNEKIPLALVDPERLVQVLINLTHNAIKFTPVGGAVTLSVERFTSEHLVVKVADTGVGIPPDDINRVFERFYKVDKARAGGETGTGLGLAIAKHVVQAHGGEIWVKSKYGSGSTFFFTVPVFSRKE